jgi:hypothetical protein
MDSVLWMWLALGLAVCAGWILVGFVVALLVGRLWRS